MQDGCAAAQGEPWCSDTEAHAFTQTQDAQGHCQAAGGKSNYPVLAVLATSVQTKTLGKHIL